MSGHCSDPSISPDNLTIDCRSKITPLPQKSSISRMLLSSLLLLLYDYCSCQFLLLFLKLLEDDWSRTSRVLLPKQPHQSTEGISDAAVLIMTKELKSYLAGDVYAVDGMWCDRDCMQVPLIDHVLAQLPCQLPKLLVRRWKITVHPPRAATSKLPPKLPKNHGNVLFTGIRYVSMHTWRRIYKT